MTISVALRPIGSLLLLLTMLPSQEPAPVCDRSAIDWVLPGNFPTAVARAQQDQRILVIKGISFGVDSAGAACATKGVW